MSNSSPVQASICYNSEKKEVQSLVHSISNSISVANQLIEQSRLQTSSTLSVYMQMAKEKSTVIVLIDNKGPQLHTSKSINVQMYLVVIKLS